jgi:hypothetical protein
MAEQALTFVERLHARLGSKVVACVSRFGQTTLDVSAEHWVEAARALRDDPPPFIRNRADPPMPVPGAR